MTVNPGSLEPDCYNIEGARRGCTFSECGCPREVRVVVEDESLHRYGEVLCTVTCQGRNE